jgi:hypothetical protein
MNRSAELEIMRYLDNNEFKITNVFERERVDGEDYIYVQEPTETPEAHFIFVPETTEINDNELNERIQTEKEY